MNVKAEKWLVDDSESYKIVEFRKCCDKIVEYSNIRLTNECSDDTWECVYSAFFVRETFDCEGFTTTEYDTIHFCPFCGEKIIVEIVKTIDKTDLYNALKKGSDFLCKEYNKTDSISRQREINKEVQEIRKEIDSLLNSDGFPMC